MFCPRCGVESPEQFKFCKSCGANLQGVSEVMSGTAEDPLTRIKADAVRLKDTLVESGVSFGYAFKDEARKMKWEARKEARKAKWQARMAGVDFSRPDQSKDTDPNLSSPVTTPYVKPREWLRLSWQYNLKNGLLSLFGGLAQAGVLYYLFHVAINAGTIEDLEARAHIRGFQALAEIIWLIAAIPVMKGLGQIIYAAFFAESVKTLSERFSPKRLLEGPPASFSVPPQNAAPVNRGQDTAPTAPPPSVTEQTTNILERGEQRIAGEAR
jgi:hypothetical protein